MSEPTLGYVITWRYGDGSGSGAVAAFADKRRAERLLNLLDTQDSMRQFKLEPVPLDSGADGLQAVQAPSQLVRALQEAEGRLMTLDNMNHPAIPRNDDVLATIRAALTHGVSLPDHQTFRASDGDGL